MRKIPLNTNITVFDSFDELSKETQELLECAQEAKEKAYAPYSNFKVGAALLLENGMIVSGNNQENAAYPSGICAERVAIWRAASEFPEVAILKLAVTASATSHLTKKPVAPCGACRQTLSEYEINQQQPIEVYLKGDVGKIIKVDAVMDLLPIAFDKSFL